MIVHTGGKASSFKNLSSETDSISTSGTALFRIHGTNYLNTCAVEVPCVGVSLNSDDAFVVVSSAIVTIWLGRGANPLEKDTASNVAGILANG